MSSPMSSPSGRRAGASWLPLLRRLSDLEPSWCIWKNVDAAVAGIGDVDSAAPREAWSRIEHEFRQWAAESNAGPVVVCRHAPATLVLVACAPDDRARLLQLDVYERVARIVRAEALGEISELDGRGFRRVPPGAEGVLLLLSTSRRGGRPPDPPALVARISELVGADPGGAEAATALLGSGRAAAQAAVRGLTEGRWRYGAMAGLEIVFALNAARRPQDRLRWLRFRLAGDNRCGVLSALGAGRTIPGDVDRWLIDVSSNHRIYTS